MKQRQQQFRLNQAIAKAGVCSRRAADRLISAGRVSVNGKIVVDFSLSIDPDGDELAIDGQAVSLKSFVYIAMNKPPGVVTTCSDEFGRTNILDLLPEKLRHLKPVGRLDMDSEGLIILTNDGELTQKITHPAHHLEKVYLVTVDGRISDKHLKQMSAGIILPEGRTLPAQTRLIKRTDEYSVFELMIKEGKNRQIRRMSAKLGYRVVRLLRVAIGGLQLGQMAPGAWRYLSRDEINWLES